MIPIRRLLLRTGFVLLIAGLGGLVGLWWWSLHRALDDQGAARARASLLHIDRELRTRVEFAENLGTSLAALWERGVLSPGHDRTTPSLLISLLQREKVIPVVILLNEAGDGVLADRRSGRWTVSLMRREGNRTQLQECEIDATGGLRPIAEPTWVDADFRHRPWYIQAAKTPRPTWTKAYRFQRLQALGVSFPVPVRTPEGRLLGAVNVDFLLDDLSQVLWNARPTPGSTTALTDAEGQVLVLPRTDEFATPEQRNDAFLRLLSEDFLPQFLPEPSADSPGPVRAGGHSYFVDRLAIHGPEGIHWVLHLAIPSEDLLAAPRRRASIGLFLAVLLLALAVWQGRELSRRLADPLSQLSTDLEQLSQGELISPPPSAVAEIHHLGQALRLASQELREQGRLKDELRRAQRIELVGTLSAGIAHDVNNQLSAILGQIELAQDQMTRGMDPARALSRAEAATRQAGEIMGSLLGFARGNPSAKVRPTDLNALVGHVAELLRHSRAKDALVVADLQPGLPPVLADRVQLEQVLMNLGLNGLDAMAQGGTLTFSTGLVHGELRVQVKDTGSGMTPEVLDHLFQAFFTTKGEGQGTGLGLAMVQGIVKAHGGRIEVTSIPGEGSTFTVWLPEVEGAGRLDPPAA